MSSHFALAQLQGAEGRISRNLLADLRASEGKFRSHDHAENALNPVAAFHAKGQPDIASQNLDTAGVHEKFRTTVGVDLFPAHVFCTPAALGRICALNRHHAAHREELATGICAEPHSYGNCSSTAARSTVVSYRDRSSRERAFDLNQSRSSSPEQPKQSISDHRNDETEHHSAVYPRVIVGHLRNPFDLAGSHQRAAPVVAVTHSTVAAGADNLQPRIDASFPACSKAAWVGRV